VIAEYTLGLRKVRFQAHIGASRKERAIRQELLVDVDLVLPVSALPRRDRRRDVVDYDAVACAVVEESAAEGGFALLETYAARVAARLLAQTPARRVRVAVTKAKVPTTHPVEAAVVEVVAVRDGAD